MILIVDDERNNLLIVGKLLDTLGLEYNKARNGKEAIDLFIDNHYDLVLLDIQMPIMDGLTCAKTIRNLKGAKSETPLVALTAQIFREELNNYKKYGINDYLIKPFEIEELKKVIDKHLASNLEQQPVVKKDSVSIDYHTISLDYINGLSQGDVEFKMEMLQAIIEDLPKYVLKLEEGVDNKDFGMVNRSAHKLNSPLSSIGLKSLSVIDFFTNYNNAIESTFK